MAMASDHIRTQRGRPAASRPTVVGRSATSPQPCHQGSLCRPRSVCRVGISPRLPNRKSEGFGNFKRMKQRRVILRLKGRQRLRAFFDNGVPSMRAPVRQLVVFGLLAAATIGFACCGGLFLMATLLMAGPDTR